MNEYISREDYCEENCGKENREGYKTCKNCGMLNIPTADVQPVKRGKWCPPLMGQGKFATYCSRCHYTVMRNSAGIFEETPFCPHCGADMRGDTNG